MHRVILFRLVLFFPLITLFVWILSLQYTILYGNSVTVAVTGYDPRDLLSGHYLSLTPDWTNTDCTQFEENKCPKTDFETRYRFYISEDIAPQLEKLINQLRPNMSLEFSYRNHHPAIRSLLIENTPWQEWYDAKKQ